MPGKMETKPMHQRAARTRVGLGKPSLQQNAYIGIINRIRASGSFLRGVICALKTRIVAIPDTLGNDLRFNEPDLVNVGLRLEIKVRN